MIRYIRPVPARSARGLVQEVYAQIRNEFGTLGEPLTLHSPLPPVLAGLWCSFRESLVAGVVPRAVKEAVAVGVSRLNECAYCIDAHAVLLRAADAHEAAALIQKGNEGGISDPQLRAAAAWAKATRSPGAQILRFPPFSGSEAPEIIGTAVWIHYINRMSKIFLGGNLIPGRLNRLGLRSLAERAGGWVFASSVRRPRLAGESLRLVPEAKLPEDLAWAAESATVARAFAAFAAAVEEAGSQALEPAVRECVLARVEEWSGSEPGLSRSWAEPAVSGLEAKSRPAARLALLAALAPHHVAEDVIAGFLSQYPGDERLLGALAWSSFTAARRIGSWLNPDAAHQELTRGSA